MSQITIVAVEEQRAAESVLAPTSTHPGPGPTSFAWA